jgi:hypothetical protein
MPRGDSNHSSLDRRFDDLAAAQLHAVSAFTGRGRDGLSELRAVEHEPDVVLGGIARWKALPDELVVARTAELLAVVVRARAPRQEAQPVAHPKQIRTERVGHAGLEPADHARARAAQDCAGFPGLAQHPIDPMDAPDCEHVRRVAPTDEDQVRTNDPVAEIFGRPGVKDDVGRVGSPAESLVEDNGVVGVVGRCGRQKANPRTLLASHPEKLTL